MELHTSCWVTLADFKTALEGGRQGRGYSLPESERLIWHGREWQYGLCVTTAGGLTPEIICLQAGACCYATVKVYAPPRFQLPPAVWEVAGEYIDAGTDNAFYCSPCSYDAAGVNWVQLVSSWDVHQLHADDMMHLCLTVQRVV
jgi:hypothetical protein